jgi:hypothetical protein
MTQVFVIYLDQHKSGTADQNNLPDYAEPTGRLIGGLEEYIVGTIAEKKAFIDNINMI